MRVKMINVFYTNVRIPRVRKIYISTGNCEKNRLYHHSLDESHIDGKLAGKISYNIDFSLVDFYLAQGKNVILDSPCLYEEMVEKGIDISSKYNADYKYIECYVSDFVEINNRLKNRVRKISQISEVHSEDIFLTTLNNSKKPPDKKCFIVHTTDPVHTYIEDVIAYINY